MAKKQIEVQSVTDEIAESLRKIAAAGEAMKRSGLNEKAQVVLLQEAIGSKYISRDQIRYVLEELPRLAKTYLEN